MYGDSKKNTLALKLLTAISVGLVKNAYRETQAVNHLSISLWYVKAQAEESTVLQA